MSSDSDEDTFNPSQGLRKSSLTRNNRGCDESIASTSFSNFSLLGKSKLSLSLRKRSADQTLKEPERPKSRSSDISDHDSFDFHNGPKLSKSPSPPLIKEDLFQEDQRKHIQPLDHHDSPEKKTSSRSTTPIFTFNISSPSSASSDIPVSQKYTLPKSFQTSPTEIEAEALSLGDDTDEVETQPPPKKSRTSGTPSPTSSSITIPAAPKKIVRKSEQLYTPLSQEPVKRCVICFIPANVVGEALEIHSNKCQPKSSAPPCRDGPNCKSLSRAHYNAYRHELEVHQSSESSILTLSLASGHVGDATQPLPVPILEEPMPDLDETVPLNPQNVSPTKIAYIQKWVNSYEVVDDDMDRQSVTSSNSGIAPKASTASDSVVLLEDRAEELQRKCMVTPVKNNRTTEEGSSGSKQTSITEFFTPMRSPGAQAKTTSTMTLEMTKIKSSTLVELGVPTVPFPSTPATAPAAAPASFTTDSRAQWNVLMSRMRGTATNVEKEISGLPAKVTEIAKCPFYKRIPNTGFAVDAFSYGPIPGVTSYFLSHFHWDHYRGLGKWLNKPMYCSQITANLVRLKIRAVSDMIRVLPLNESRLIDNIEVVLIDANHCPGSVMFLFRFPTGQTVLHTGDFRADKSMHNDTQLNARPIDHLYLDTTYCNEYYKLPAQSEVIEYVRRLVRQYVNKYPKLLVVVGTYTVGKEKVFITAANELNCLIWAPTEKRTILKCLEDSVISRRLFADPHRCNVHVVNTSDIKAANLTSYYQQFKSSFTHILALHPTGWEHDDSVANCGLDSIKPKSYGNIFIYGVPYSEHSSYEELKSFVCHFKPSKIIPHVGVGSAATRRRMEEIFNEWRNHGNWAPKNSQKTTSQSNRGKSLRPRGGQSKKF